MNAQRLADYVGHMQQAAMDACDFVGGLTKDDFLKDKRTQQAVIMSLVIIGEAATKVINGCGARVCIGASSGALAQYAGNAQSYRAWLF